MRRHWSIAGQLFALQVLVVVVLVAIGTTGAILLARQDARDAAIEEVTAIADTLARSPTVIDALGSPDPTAVLQPYAEATRLATDTDFIVVMAPDRTRYTHPTPAQIGQPFIGSVDDALAGRTIVETYTGTLGESVRTVVPVRSAGGTVIGMVSAGITTDTINDKLFGQLPAGAIGLLAALAVAGAGSWLLSRRLRRQTHGLGPGEMTRMYEYYDAVLHSVREGLVVVDRDGRLALINDEGRRLLDLSDEPVADRPVAALPLPGEVGELLTSRRDAVDEPVLAGGRVLVANQRETRFDGRPLGTVLTLRDHTELRALTGELDSVRGLTEALRSQAHEAANRLHTVLTLVELGRTEDAVRLATDELTRAQELTDQVVGSVREPALAALLLGKSAQAAERGVELTVEGDSAIAGEPVPVADLLTVVGNLVDNALEAVAGVQPPRRVRVVARQDDAEVLIRVTDNGPGIPPDQAGSVFARGWSTKRDGRGIGLALVRQVVDRHGGSYAVTAAEPRGADICVRLPIVP